MTGRLMIAGVGLLLCVVIHAITQAAEAPPSQETAATEKHSGDNRELLLFFEEQDLVTATKRATMLRKAPAIATIITADEIKNMGARNLLDILKMVPGVGVSTNETAYNIIEVRGIRSYLSEKILIMIDGHPLNRNITGSALYGSAEMMPLENIRQVEVIRGPASALYGNSAFVATINVITRNAEEIDGIEVKAGGGSFDTWRTNLVGGVTIGELSISGSIDHYQTRGPQLEVERDALSGTPFSLAPGTPQLGFRQTDSFLKVGYGNLMFRGGYRTLRKDIFLGFGSAIADNNNQNIDTYWGTLSYSVPITDDLAVSANLYQDYFEQNPNVKILPDGFTGDWVYPNGMFGKPLVKNRTVGGELQVDWDVFTGNHLIAGFSFDSTKQYDVKQRANFNPITGAPLPTIQTVVNWNKDVTREIWALYLQDEWQFPYDINLTAGVRYDHYSDFGDTINPRFALVWSFLEKADLKLLYGQAFRAPNFQELYNIHNPAILGNSRLKPEKIETFEGGITYRLNRYFGAEVNYFYSTIDDQIDLDSSIVPIKTYSNIRKSVTQGIECGLNGSLIPELSWKANYAWQDPRDGNTGRRLPFVPSHRASGSVNYAMNRHVNLHTDLLWTGSRLRTAEDSRKEVSDYTTVDVTATLRNFWNTLEIQATIRNLFDTRYHDPSLPEVPGDLPREGVSGFVTASYRF